MPSSAPPTAFRLASRFLSLLLIGLAPGFPLEAEETEDGSDVEALLHKAEAGDLAAQLEVTEHFLVNATAETDDAPARDFKQVEKWLQAAALQGSAPASRMLGELLISDYPGIPANPARAFAAFRKAALGGDLRAMLAMGHLLSSGTGTLPDSTKAEEWLQKALEAAPEGSPERDQASLALQRLADLREAEAERDVLARQAESTDPETRFQLGRRLLSEAGGDKEQQAAAAVHLRFAAEAGHAAAQDAYGIYLEQSDRAAGFAWRLKAAEAGLASAQGYAALVLLRGSGPIQADPAKGLDLAVRAQLQGDQLVAKTLNGAGYFPGLGSGEAQNLAYSAAPADRTRLLEAAARGEPEAQRWLARGPKPETGAVTRWLAAAAKQEHPGAQFSLGLAYFNGNEVPRNRIQATAWRSRAALLGYPEAQLSLAQDLLEGSGVPANPALARYWFERVAASSAFIEGHRQIARDKAAALTVAALPPAAALEQTKNLALTARLPDAMERIAATATQSAPASTRAPNELRAAAEKGEVAAMYELGRAELDRRQAESNRGSGVVTVDRQRDANDFRWIMAAARAGHPEAQFLAATHWLSAESDAGKKAWLEKAAAQGHATAKERLDTAAKEAATAATQAADAAKRSASDRELVANGDGDAAFRLFRSRVKEISAIVVADFIAEQNGQPTSGKKYSAGFLDSEMTKWIDLIVNTLQLDGIVLLHDYLRDARPEFAYRMLLLRQQLAQAEPRLALTDGGFGTNSRAGFEKALVFLRGKLPADQRATAEKLAANQFGGPWVENTMGANFERGIGGFPKDFPLALAHYRIAAEAGEASAQCNVGRCYELGYGVAKDPDQARAWYTKAAARGSKTAQNRLKDLDTFVPMVRIRGLTAEERAKLTDDEWVAAEALMLNGEQREKLFGGDPVVTMAVAVNYRDGANGFVQDHGRAFHWFTEAAQKGGVDADTELGNLHYRGLGRPADKAAAFRHYLRAAERGSAVGQLNAGFCYLQGEGVARDPVAAHDWLVKAAAQGQPNAQALVENLKRDSALQLLLAQRSEAQALDQAKQGAANAVASAPAWDPIKDNPILQLGALATKALQGDAAAAAALDAQQLSLKSQRDLINGTAAAALADFEENLRRVRSQHDGAALTDLAERLEKGQGVAADPERALALYREAAGEGINRRAELAVVRLQHELEAALSAHPAPPVPNAGPMKISNLLVEAMSADERTDPQKMMNASYRLRNAAEALEREDRMRSFLFTPLELGRKAMAQGNKDEAKSAWLKAAAAGTTAAVAELKKHFPEIALPPPVYQPSGPALWPGAAGWEQAQARLMEITASWKQNPGNPGQFSAPLDELSKAGLAEAAAFRARVVSNNYVAVAPVDNPGEVRGAAQRIDNIVEFTNRAINLGHAESAWLLRQFRYFPGKSREDAMQLAVAKDQPSADELVRAAKSGEVEAQLALAAKLGRTQPDQAVYWLGCAARNGHAAADLALAGFYTQGQLVPADSQQAVCWLARAAIKGRQEAQIIFGDYLAGKYGGQAQPAYARFWYERAAAFGRDGDYVAQLARMRAAQIDTPPPRVAAAFAQAKELSGRAVIPELPKKN